MHKIATTIIGHTIYTIIMCATNVTGSGELHRSRALYGIEAKFPISKN